MIQINRYTVDCKYKMTSLLNSQVKILLACYVTQLIDILSSLNFCFDQLSVKGLTILLTNVKVLYLTITKVPNKHSSHKHKMLGS